MDISPPPAQVVIEASGIPKVRKSWQVHPIIDGSSLCVPNNSLHNLVHGVVERQLFVKGSTGKLVPPPAPKPDAWVGRSARFLAVLRRVLCRIHPVSREQFALLYQGRRRTIYANAVKSLLSRPVRWQDAFISAFVKAEKTMKRKFVPRIISPRSPRYNVEVGRYLKPFEHAIYKAIAAAFRRAVGGHVVAKGLNADQVGQLIHKKFTSFTSPAAFMMDMSRFDQHVSVPALKAEHSVYKSMCVTEHERRELSKLLEWQLRNKVFGRASNGLVKYMVEGGRMSGDMNTALGNCLLMCWMIWIWFDELGIEGDLINNGDDCVVFVESHHIPLLEATCSHFFLDFGFTVKAEAPVYELEHIEFCQTRPVLVGEHYRMVRDPFICVQKDATSLVDLSSDKVARRWFHSVGHANLALCAGVPVTQAAAMAYVRAGGNEPLEGHLAMETGAMFLSRGMTPEERPITEATRYSFWLAFGIVPDEQRVLESEFSSMELTTRRPPVKERSDQPSLLLLTK